MKKILSIAATSFISTAILAVSANAASGGNQPFESYKARLCSNECKTDISACQSQLCETDKILQELLNDCYTKYYDDCIFDDNLSTSQPDKENNSQNNWQSNTPNKPSEQNPPKDDTTSVPSDITQGESTDAAFQKIIRQVVDLVNKERKAAGLSAVSAENVKLANAASVRAKEQATSFSHTRPSGKSWTTVLTDYGISYRAAGENVAYGQQTASEVMNAWMNSAGHRANILNGNYKEIGVGVYYKNGTYYWSQIFIG